MTDSGFFGETWSSTLVNSLGVNDKLLNILPNSMETDFPDTKLGKKLEIVSKLISTRDKRGADRDTFYVELGGFDTHDDVEERLNILFEEVNDAISALSDQLKVMEVWDKVTTIQLSDFARTLTPNGGNGTDHGWGGNYIMFGGAVKGGKILGTYPDDLSEEGTQIIGRGRVIPSTPWDACFHGIADWFGVGMEDMDEACPNCENFPDSQLFRADDMFETINPDAPTMSPITEVIPTASPVSSPAPTPKPTITITKSPTPTPTTSPTKSPSHTPTKSPTISPSKSPTKSPTTSPTKSLTTSPTTSPKTDCPRGKSKFVVELMADKNSKRQNKYSIQRRKGAKKWKQIVKKKGFTNSALHTFDICLKTNKCHRFKILDKKKNGLCCQYGEGGYKIYYKGNELKHVKFDENFGKKFQSKKFGKCSK